MQISDDPGKAFLRDRMILNGETQPQGLILFLQYQAGGGNLHALGAVNIFILNMVLKGFIEGDARTLRKF